MKEYLSADDTITPNICAGTQINQSEKAPYFIFDIICQSADGTEKWREQIHNTVTVGGKTDLIAKYFTGSSYTAAWYLGLVGSGTISSSDTLASHSGWAEVTPYTGNRPSITFGTTSSGSNTANTVTYSITSAATVAGAFIASVNTGASGILYSASDFASPRTLASGDTLNVTPTVSVS